METECIVHQRAVLDAIKTLVGGLGFQPAQRLDIGSDLDIVEVLYMPTLGQLAHPRVPRHFAPDRADITRHSIQGLQVSVAPHQAHARHIWIARQELVHSLGNQRFTYIRAQLRTMATGAQMRATANIESKRSLVRNFLKDNIVIYKT